MENRRIISILASLFAISVSFAQLSITPNFDKEAKSGHKDNSWSALKSPMSISWEFETSDSIRSISSFTYSINEGNVFQISSYTLKEGKLTMKNPINISSLAVGNNDFKFTINYVGKDSKSHQASGNCSIQICNEPKIESIEGLKEQLNMCSDKTIQYSYEIKNNENSGIWSYEWKKNNVKQVETARYSFSLNPATSQQEATYSFHCKSVSPHGVVWYDSDTDYTGNKQSTITQYPPLKIIGFTTNPKQNYQAGDKLYATIGYTGGIESKNQIAWMHGEDPVAGATTAELSLQLTSSVSTSMMDGVSVTITCKDDLNNELKVNKTAKYTIWQKASVDGLNGNTKRYVLNGDTIKDLSVKVSGGYANGWKYSWTDENGKDWGNKSAIDELVVSEQFEKESINKTLTVIVKDTVPEYENLWVKKSLDYNIYVYNKPTITKVPSNNIINVEEGQKITLSIDYSGGCSTGWVWQWKEDGKSLSCTQSSLTKSFDKKQSNITVTCVATNYADASTKENKLFETTQTFTIKVWPKAKVEGLIGDETRYVINGDTIRNLGIVISGGYTDGWKYSWTDEKGKYLGNKRTIDEFVISEQFGSTQESIKKTLTVVVKDSVPEYDEPWIKETKEYEIFVYKKPIIKKDPQKDTIDVITDQETTLNVSASGGCPEGWAWQWEEDGMQLASTQSSITKEFKYKPSTINVECIATNSAGGQQIYQTTQTFKINVWKKGEVINKPTSTSIIHDKQKQDIVVKTQYGYKEKWNYTWYITENNVSQVIPQQTTATYTYTPKEVRQKTDVSITCIAINKGPNNEDWTKDSVVYKYEVWPEPQVKLSDGTKEVSNVIVDSTYTLSLDTIGGYLTGWDIQWTKNQELIPAWNGKVSINDVFQKDETAIYMVSCSNKAGELVWLEKEFTLKVSAYAYGSVKKIEKPDSASIDGFTDVYENSQVNLRTESSKGYPSGWRYSWTDNEYSIQGSQDSLSFICPSPKTVQGANYGEKHNFVMQAQNLMDDKELCNTTISFKLRYWKQCVFHDDLAIIDAHNNEISASRYGNPLYLKMLVPAEYGYCSGGKSNMKYIWYQSNSIIDATDANYIQLQLTQPSGKKKQKVTYTYSLQIHNYGPTGHKWDSSDLYSKAINMYARPKTPTSLKVMGNGSTGTYIATIDGIVDSDLKYYEYYLVFGYTDKNGIDHNNKPIEQKEGTSRFDSFVKSVLEDTSNKVYVYAQWVYDDGAIVTSGKRYVSSVDENWDGSDFSKTTRAGGDETSISSLVDEESTPSEIYSVDGQKKLELSTGINIVKFQNGSIKKVMIK